MGSMQGYDLLEVFLSRIITFKSEIGNLSLYINNHGDIDEDEEALKIWRNRLDRSLGGRQLEQARVCYEGWSALTPSGEETKSLAYEQGPTVDDTFCKRKERKREPRYYGTSRPKYNNNRVDFTVLGND